MSKFDTDFCSLRFKLTHKEPHLLPHVEGEEKEDTQSLGWMREHPLIILEGASTIMESVEKAFPKSNPS